MICDTCGNEIGTSTWCLFCGILHGVCPLCNVVLLPSGVCRCGWPVFIGVDAAKPGEDRTVSHAVHRNYRCAMVPVTDNQLYRPASIEQELGLLGDGRITIAIVNGEVVATDHGNGNGRGRVQRWPAGGEE